MHIKQKKQNLQDIVLKPVFDFLSEKIGWDKTKFNVYITFFFSTIFYDV